MTDTGCLYQRVVVSSINAIRPASPRNAGSILDTSISTPVASRTRSPTRTSAAVTVVQDSVMRPSCRIRRGRCYGRAMAFPLSTETLRLVDGRNYAVLATVNLDGSPQTSVMWVGRDGADLLFSTVEGRLKHRNMVRDPRVSVTIIDSADPENYVELRGTASMTPDIGSEFDNQLSWKYDGKDKDPDRPGAVRVVVRITVRKATGPAA